ncbi:hypothetical protein MITS9508_00168 [Synechococcus sp. MIT S9508]|nr:hypothetical protein MITS9508_00168 [Synechococcus sp. MIT S9508]
MRTVRLVGTPWAVAIAAKTESIARSAGQCVECAVSLRSRAWFMTDVDYLINRFHELFRRQDDQRQLKRLTLEEQKDQEIGSPEDDGELP